MGEITKSALNNLPQAELAKNPFIRGFAVPVVADSNGLVQIKTDGNPRGVMVLEAPGVVDASIRSTKNGITTIRLTRQWEFLERYSITKTTASFDFREDLRGDLDGDYRLDSYWASSAVQYLYLRVNGLTTTLASEGTAIVGSTTATVAGIAIAYGSAAEGSEHTVRTELVAATGETRHAISHDASSVGASAANTEANYLAAKWSDKTAKITSLGVQPSTGSIASGSHFDLYRKPKFDKSTILLWVY